MNDEKNDEYYLKEIFKGMKRNGQIDKKVLDAVRGGIFASGITGVDVNRVQKPFIVNRLAYHSNLRGKMKISGIKKENYSNEKLYRKRINLVSFAYYVFVPASLSLLVESDDDFYFKFSSEEVAKGTVFEVLTIGKLIFRGGEK